MSLYLEQIRQLVSLQRVDDAIFAIENELDQAPKEISELQKRFSDLDTQRNHMLEKVAHLVDQERRVNLEIEEEDARIRKSRNKLMQVSNNREYQAMAREIDNFEKSNQLRMAERSTLVEEKKHQEVILADVESKWQATKQEMDERNAALEGSLAEAKGRLEELNKVRVEAGKEVPRPVLDRYEFIRHRLPHPVIVPVTAGVCEGCRIMIPPQTFIELQGGQKILNCPNCQRLIYWSEHFKDSSSEGQAENEAVSGEPASEASE